MIRGNHRNTKNNVSLSDGATPVTSRVVKSEAGCSCARRVQASGQEHLTLKVTEAALTMIERHCQLQPTPHTLGAVYV